MNDDERGWRINEVNDSRHDDWWWENHMFISDIGTDNEGMFTWWKEPRHLDEGSSAMKNKAPASHRSKSNCHPFSFFREHKTCSKRRTCETTIVLRTHLAPTKKMVAQQSVASIHLQPNSTSRPSRRPHFPCSCGRRIARSGYVSRSKISLLQDWKRNSNSNKRWILQVATSS